MTKTNGRSREMAGQAAGYSPGCGQIPIVYGIPPRGFETGPDRRNGGVRSST
jgi:hypothetical protein